MISEQYIDLIYFLLTEKGNIVEMIKTFQEKNGHCYSTEIMEYISRFNIRYPGIFADGYNCLIDGKEDTIKFTKEDLKEYDEYFTKIEMVSFEMFLRSKYENIALRKKRKLLITAAACIVIVLCSSIALINHFKSESIIEDTVTAQEQEMFTTAKENTSYTEAQTTTYTSSAETTKQTETEKTEIEQTVTEQTETATEQTEPAEVQYGYVEVDIYFNATDTEAQLINAMKSPYYMYLDGEKIDGKILPNDCTSFTGNIEAGKHTLYVKSGTEASKEFTITVDPNEELNLFEFDLGTGVIKPELKKR